MLEGDRRRKALKAEQAKNEDEEKPGFWQKWFGKGKKAA